VLFVLQNAPMPPVELGGLVMTPLAADVSMSHFDLTLDVVEEEGVLRCTLEYNSDLFDAATARRIISHLETLLGGVATSPGLRLSALPLLTAAEEQRQLVEWNDTASEYPADLCLHQLFEAQAGRTPDAPALAFEELRLSYAEVNHRADVVARRLVESGAGPETLVALLLERSAEAVICLLGVLKAGAAYLPIDPTYPSERIAFMIEDASARLLLTQRRLVDGLPAHAARVLCIEECVATNGEGAAFDATPSAHQVAPENLAYVIYTSGSTGKPKGVMIPHSSVVNHNFAVAERYALSADDRVLQFASLSFDVAVEEIFPTWLVGGCVVVRPDRALDSHRAFLDLLERERVTAVNLSTPYWNELIAELGRTGSSLSASLRLAAIGGEKGLPQDFALSQRAMSPAARLLNVYGPTETTVTNTAQDFDAARSTSPSVPIGRPLHNTRLYVFDRHLRPTPVGVCGELFIGGHSLARGYLERPELTAEKFLPDPYSTEPGARMYRSGDVCRLLANGEVEFVGRVDEQVKVRGFRVELGEIESALAQHPQVRHALVLVREEAAGGKRLIAYVVSDEADQMTTAGLRAYLKERLPDYMVPSFFVLLDEFPLTANGKVDRRLLPEPSESSQQVDEYVAPRTGIEEMVCGLLGNVLGRERVGLNDDFFELGGHSLMATQVMSRVREAFDVEMPLRTLFEHPTAGALAQQIEEGMANGLGLQAPAISRASRTGLLPLSFAQQRLWLLDQLEPGNAFYNVPVAVRLKGGLKFEALERTLSEVVRRHEVLRTTFTVVEDEPIQVIHEARPLPLPVEDLSRLEPAERSAEAERLTREEAERPFDLERGPLLRAVLLRLAPEEHIILLTMHHVVSDGWSIGVLIKEVASLYESYSEGRESPLAELPVQYADYAVWQREYLRGEVLERQLAYWRRQLAGARQVLELPTDRPRPPVQTFDAATEQFGLGETLSAHVKRLSREQGCTLYMTLMAGFEVLLGRYSGQEDMLIGTAIANRQQAETESLIGFFVNTLVMRADLSREPTFVELMGRVREVALGAYAHQDVPFERLVEEIAPERSLSQTPLFQVAFGVYNESEQKLEIAGLEVSGADSVTETGRFDLTLWMWEEQSGEIRGRWIYNTDLFDAGTAARMSRHLTRLLESAAAAPGERIGKLAMLTDEEINQQLQRKRTREEANVKKLKTSRRQAVTSTRQPSEQAGTGPQDGKPLPNGKHD
ncbi:MAG TPA: amino acid adenylation domain-containing protein, partial [Pyrinomonadaceae bacterium]|nr:amino acid adenylation domain-containing protein [Pyrinomonadaceae bacterium]